MKNTDEIKDRLAKEEQSLQKIHTQYECAGDYVRGWVDALRWALREGQ